MAVPNKTAVVEAMRNDLGVQRVDDLKLENGRQGCSVRPEAIHQQALDMSAVKPPKLPHNPIANKWRAAIAGGEFDDDDAETVKGLDKIGGGRLHALNHPQRPPLNPPPGLSRANGIRGGFNDGRSAAQFRTPGPPARMPVHGMPMGNPAITTGPRRASSSIQNRPTTRSSPARVSSMGTSRPRNGAGLIHFEVSQQPPPVFYDPKPNPSECFHKAYICVADRLAKGNGIVYLLTTSPTDTGKFCIYLEGTQYLEYSVLDMINYIANSHELCPQFVEADGVSITTTSMVFHHQSAIALFMDKVRTLQARRSAMPNDTTPNIVIDAPITKTTTRQPSPSPTVVLSGAKSVDISSDSSPVIEKAIAERAAIPTKEKAEHQPAIAIPEKQASVQKVSGAGKSSLDDQKAADKKPATVAPVPGHVEGRLVDLSQPLQSSPATRPIFHRLSSYVVDLGSLDLSMSNCTPQQEQPAKPDEIETFTRELREALPMIERAGQVLASIGEDERGNAVKSALDILEGTSGGKEFLHALHSLPKKVKDGEVREAKVLSREPKYTAKEIMALRSNAKTPPRWLSKTGFLPPRIAPPPIKSKAQSGQLQGTKENDGGVGRSTHTPAGNGPSTKPLVSVNAGPVVKPSTGGMKGLGNSRWAVGGNLDGKHS